MDPSEHDLYSYSVPILTPILILRKFKSTEKYKKYDKISIYHNPELSSI